MTGACPCKCKYCYAEAGGTQAPDLGDDRVRDIARGLADARVPLVILGGGEPLTRFERLISLIEMLSPSSEVRLATSGVGLTSLRARKLRDAGLSVVAVSLDSHEREAVDQARGYDGAFAAGCERPSLFCGSGARHVGDGRGGPQHIWVASRR